MTNQGKTGFLIDDWRVSPPEGLLTRGTEAVRLEPKAMEVLVYLASHPGQVITREELEREVWHGALVGYDAVTNTVIKLRKALQDDARQPRFIATIPKKGYQLIATVNYPAESDKATMVASPRDAANTIQQPAKIHQQYRTSIIIATLAVISIISITWFWPPITGTGEPGGPVSNTASVPPSIVVLPFENLGNDPEQGYLGDGIAEDIITDLSRLANMLVIDSNTSSTYKGKLVPIEQIGKDLDVAFVLKGSVRRLGDAVRVNAQLVNAKTGYNIWAERYDRKITEVFAVQDEVTNSIVAALTVKITNQEKSRLAQRATANLEAYDHFQEGKQISKISTKEAYIQARESYRKAIELDPNYGRAYGAMSFTLANDFRRGWSDNPVDTLDRALDLAQKAVALDESTPQTHWALSFVHLMRKEYDKAEKSAQQAIDIAPNYADGYGLLALIDNHLAKPKRAIEYIDKATRLNPYYTYEYLYTRGLAYYLQGDYGAAISVLEKAQARNENAIHVKLFLAASYVRAGQQDDAEWIADQLQVLSPTATLTEIDKTIPIGDPEFKRMLLEDLRQAGLPEN